MIAAVESVFGQVAVELMEFRYLAHVKRCAWQLDALPETVHFQLLTRSSVACLY